MVKTGTNTGICTRLLLMALVVLCSVSVHGQSTDNHEALKVAPVQDDDDTAADKHDDSVKNDNYCCLIQRHAYAHFLSVDGGASAVLSTINNTTYTAWGPTWAVSAHMAYKIPAYNPNHRSFIGAGLEIRNYNGIASNTDRLGGTSYDNLHYWYAGLPITYQILNTRYNPAKKRQLLWYGQVGVTLGVMLRVNDEYSDQGTTNTFNISKHYTTFMLQPFIGGGITYKTPACTYMFGPYIGYVATNMISNNGVNEHILSFGLRLTTLFLNN